MPIQRNHPDQTKFNSNAVLPFELRLDDFAMAMQDVYDFFHDVNVGSLTFGRTRGENWERERRRYTARELKNSVKTGSTD